MTKHLDAGAAAPAEAHTLGFLLREAYAGLQQQIYAAAAAAGHPDVREVHSPVLRHLPAGGGRVADVARACGLAKQSVAYVVEDLVGLGYLKVEPDPEDGRAKRVGYTARGRKLLAALVQASGEAEERLARRLGVERVAQLRETLVAVGRDVMRDAE
jgi:DNA-binding MarR family transcriptional regulator